MPLLPPERQLGWVPYAWLIHLNAYVAVPLWYGAAAGPWAGHLAGLLAFLPLYFAGYWVEGERRRVIIVALAALGLALTWFNPGAAVFVVYAASFVGGALTGRAATAWIVGLTIAGLAAAATAGPFMPFVAVGVAVFTPIIGFVNLHEAELRRHAASLRVAHDEVARLAALAERDRIAGDLHDLLGHTLSVIVLKADLAARLIERDPARAAAEVTDVARVSRQALAEVRQAVHGFRTATLADELVRATSVLRSAGVTVEAAPDAPAGLVAPGLSRKAEHALALVLREAVTNIIRHAGATRCAITFDTTPTQATMTVVDNGAGGTVIEGHGLDGIRRRIAEAGGTLTLDTSGGVHLTVQVPL